MMTLKKKQPPRVYRGGLSGRIFVATRWSERNGQVVAEEKYDITDQLTALGVEVND